MQTMLTDPKLRDAVAAEVQVFNAFVAALQQTIGILDTAIPASAQPEALSETKLFLESLESVVFSLQNYIRQSILTNDCSGLFPIEPRCPVSCLALLNDSIADEVVKSIGDISAGTPILPRGDQAIFPESVASPFLPLPIFGDFSNRQPQETLFSGAVEGRGGHVILKEIFGLKLRLWYHLIPIWAEPWYPRRRIVGYKKIWYLSFVPCEYVKSIIFNSATTSPIGTSRLGPPKVVAYEFCDSRLNGYWRWYKAW